MINSFLFGLIILTAFLFIQLNKAKKKIKEQESIINNRDIPEIIKLEEEKWKLQKEKEEARLAIKIKDGEYNLSIAKTTLYQALQGLNQESLMLKIKGTDIQISDKLKCYTIKSVMTNKKLGNSYHDTLKAFDNIVVKTVDKKTFINALKAISTPFTEIVFYSNSPSIDIKQPRSGTIVTIQAK